MVRSPSKMVQAMQMVEYIQHTHVSLVSVSVGFWEPVEFSGVFSHLLNFVFGEGKCVGISYTVPSFVDFRAGRELEKRR